MCQGIVFRPVNSSYGASQHPEMTRIKRPFSQSIITAIKRAFWRQCWQPSAVVLVTGRDCKFLRRYAHLSLTYGFTFLRINVVYTTFTRSSKLEHAQQTSHQLADQRRVLHFFYNILTSTSREIYVVMQDDFLYISMQERNLS